MRLLRRSFIGGLLASLSALILTKPVFATRREISAAEMPAIDRIDKFTKPGSYRHGEFSFRVLERDLVLPRHSHTEAHPTVCLDGKIKVILESPDLKKRFVEYAETGEIVVVPAGWFHTIYPVDGPARYCCIMPLWKAAGVVDLIDNSKG